VKAKESKNSKKNSKVGSKQSKDSWTLSLNKKIKDL